jgi:hypothetical protein
MFLIDIAQVELATLGSACHTLPTAVAATTRAHAHPTWDDKKFN